jgi:hypothetical protein
MASLDSSTDSGSGLPLAIGRPATRAFARAGYTLLEHFTTVAEADLLRLHGVGPKSVRVLRDALAERGLGFAPPPT